MVLFLIHMSHNYVAVKKICFPHFDESHQSYDQLLHEAKTLAQLSHPNIVRYYNSWIELDEPTTAGKPLEETFQSFLLQLPNSGNCRKSYPGLDDGSLSESIDSSITAITFTEYNLTSDADQFGDDASDDATDNDFVGENENFPFGEDVVSTQRLLTNQRVTLYILMELCSTTLQEYLDQRRKVDETVSLQIFTQILLGVQYLHEKNLMHRDLRPSTIFIFQQANEEEQGNIVKIGDFSVSTDQVPYLFTKGQTEAGLPMDTSEDDRIQTQFSSGDYTYASPEQRRGAHCSQSTDIYSLGIILFALFHDCRHNQERAFKELRRRVLPSDLLLSYPNVASIILWLMSPEPDDRPSATTVLNSKLFKNKTHPEHVFIPRKDLEDLDKKLQIQESTIHQQETIIKEQERRIQELLQKEALRNSS